MLKESKLRFKMMYTVSLEHCGRDARTSYWLQGYHAWQEDCTREYKEVKQEKEYQPKKPHPRILDPYHEDIPKDMGEGLSGVRIHEVIKAKGVQAGYSTIKDYLSLIKKREQFFIRIYTHPGEEDRVDFGYVVYTIYQVKGERLGSLTCDHPNFVWITMR